MLNRGIYKGFDLRLMFPWCDIIGEDQILPYVHPNCVLPNTVCESDEILGGLSTWYDGPVFTISSSNGFNITVTPNHMFLTKHGFAAAYLLRKGDEIVCDSRFQRKPLSNMNNDGNPACINEIIKSLPMPLGMSPISVPVAAEDLHGDARFGNGNVNIVGSDRFLRRTREASCFKKLPAQNLCAYDSSPRNFFGKSTFAQFLKTAAFATDGAMSSIRKPNSFFLRRLTHPQKHAFASIARRDPSGFEAQNYAAPRDPKLLAQCLDRYASFIELNDVVSVHVKSFKGYLHDLQTASTLYSGNGIILSNCRCTLLRVTNIQDYLDALEPSDQELDIF